MSPLFFDVFGRSVRVDRVDEGWRAWYVSDEGKRRPAHDLPLPADSRASDLARHLADVAHEWATPGGSYPALVRGPGTVVFDFDSTLIVSESLEELVGPRLRSDPELRRRFEAITDRGMSGELSFADSVRERIRLARPTQADVRGVVDRLPELWTRGMPELVRDLQWRGVDVWVVSGALLDCLLPAAEALGVPSHRVCGVRGVWEDDGTLAGPSEQDPFSRSKVEGVRSAGLGWTRPSVMVGDGATDRALAEAGLVDAFVAFTGNVTRDSVVQGAAHVAESAEELRTTLDGLVP